MAAEFGWPGNAAATLAIKLSLDDILLLASQAMPTFQRIDSPLTEYHQFRRRDMRNAGGQNGHTDTQSPSRR
jgi:hypothetical protein